jgi:hypothetical protein
MLILISPAKTRQFIPRARGQLLVNLGIARCIKSGLDAQLALTLNCRANNAAIAAIDPTMHFFC